MRKQTAWLGGRAECSQCLGVSEWLVTWCRPTDNVVTDPDADADDDDKVDDDDGDVSCCEVAELSRHCHTLLCYSTRQNSHARLQYSLSSEIARSLVALQVGYRPRPARCSPAGWRR